MNDGTCNCYAVSAREKTAEEISRGERKLAKLRIESTTVETCLTSLINRRRISTDVAASEEPLFAELFANGNLSDLRRFVYCTRVLCSRSRDFPASVAINVSAGWRARLKKPLVGNEFSGFTGPINPRRRDEHFGRFLLPCS